MEFCSLASGSSGNCLLLRHDDALLLVDVGLSCRALHRALSELELDPERLLGVCVTHEHSDHIAGLATLSRRRPVPIYTSPGTARQLCYRTAGLEELLRPVEPGTAFSVGPFQVTALPSSHDAAQPLCFTIAAGGRRAAVVTDLGVVTPELLDGILGADLAVCECNHDVDRLRSGPYPPYLKARILGRQGHLSNSQGGELAVQCVKAGARTILPAHLSQENNTPQLALDACREHLAAEGFSDVTVEVLPRRERSRWYEV